MASAYCIQTNVRPADHAGMVMAMETYFIVMVIGVAGLLAIQYLKRRDKDH